MKPVVAIDAHKASCTYVVRHWNETLVAAKTIPSTREALTKLAREFPGHVFVLEVCSVHEWMMDLLRGEGVEVQAVVPPKKERKGKKSDPEDALRLAKKHQAGELKQVYVAPPELRRVRDVVHTHEFLKVKRTSFNNHIKNTLNRWNFVPAKALHAKRAPSVYAEVGRAQVLAVFPNLEHAYRVIDVLDERLALLKAEMEALGAGIPEVALLRTVPGFGPIVALALHVEIGDVHRFHSAEALVSYFGLDPVHGGSGGKNWDEHHISKEGVDYVRGLLTQAAWVHVMRCPESDITKAFHHLADDRGKTSQQAIMAVARKLTKTTYWMLKEQRPFQLTGPARDRPCRTPAAAPA